ncbi:MAG: hypothetical protein GXP62_09745 [Oligoflexia bacterium]|nr:hypothetical protein [Oligoflexia bacterium]
MPIKLPRTFVQVSSLLTLCLGLGTGCVNPGPGPQGTDDSGVGTGTGTSTSTLTGASTSCLAILSANPDATDGVYTIDPDDDGPIAAVDTFCDMSTDGGGWTLVHKNDQSGSDDRTDDGFNQAALQSATIDDVAILPRDTINAIGNTYRILSQDGVARFYWDGIEYYTTEETAMSDPGSRAKLAWEDGWDTGWLELNLNSHSVCIHGSSFAEQICIQRWCCGEPNEGTWFNQGTWSPGHYDGMTGWVQ